MKEIYRIKTISEIHHMLGLGKPKHPLVSVVNDFDGAEKMNLKGLRFTSSMYSISLKSDTEGTLFYGRNTYDFQEGTLIFIKPDQVVEYENGNERASHARTWALNFHPDLIRKSKLGENIDKYKFFDYDVREALHLSEGEIISIQNILSQIQKEIEFNIDRHSQEIIVSNIKLILDYCTRYFDRQFYTRSNMNKDVVSNFERVLNDYYKSGKALDSGVPSVDLLGKEMGMSPYYLSDLLKKETGRNTIEHIHFYIIDRAKNVLLGTNQSVSEIAYNLGFRYPQHFARVFKNKTGTTPTEYRKEKS
ncbi:MAG: AraC family transcriptional regulator [Bacteroidota bacterium]